MCDNKKLIKVAAALVLFLSIGIWIASSHLSGNSTAAAPHQVETATTTADSNRQPKESDDIAFEQWAAPYRELHIPLVSMEVAENYHPAAILPVLPADIERNH